ncbi:miraculin-like [Chenopodium quinoa]|nr:miraculin-like [Chenopodium quinoa]XP_021719343.1 miraculin-like [Chenopodium quinoa]XP_021719345.1 miraculin-like [Chenopodium quinoa]XP_021722454.1 miraculin-like [Chenopodium quinoa]XP_021722901.1 miraculin-like [Chenopodium quinoa]XP_021756603.1 miraculin-like [Chenopodium quinoa]
MANFYLQLYTTILLMFSISMVSSATTANNVDSLVLDIEGNPLEVGSFYYVRTPQSTFRWGGGIVAASKPNQPECPQYVAQLGEGWYRESPIKFLPSDPSHKHVHISSDVNVVFNNSFSACSQGAWQLTPDANSGDLFLSTGGGIGNPSPQTAANWFKIEKRRGDPGFYQLEYCPSSNTIDAFATKKDIVCGAIDGSIDNLTDDHRMIWLSLFPIRPDDYFSTGLMFFFIKA